MLGNWIRMSTTTTGTGNIAVSDVTGYPNLASQFASSQRVNYAILDSNNLPLERGIGYHDGAGNFVREAVKSTYVSGVYTGAAPSAVSLASGTKYLIVTAGAQSLISARPGAWANNLKVYGDMNVFGGGGSTSTVANVVYGFIFHSTVDSDIDAVIFRVNGAIASTNARCAIYDITTGGLPGVQLALGASIATDTTGNKVSNFTRFRPPPSFYVLLMSDGNPALASYASGLVGGFCLGADSSLNPSPFWLRSGATYPNFPTTWTGLSGAASNAARYALFVRCVP